MTQWNSDTEHLSRIRAGDPDALAVIFEQFELPVFRYLLGVLKDRHAAEDVLQDTFVAVLRKAETITGESFRSWLFTVAHQKALLLKRKAQRTPEPVAHDRLLELVRFEFDPLAAAIRAESAAVVRSLLAQLPEPQQAVIRLRVFDGLKFREVADRLGCPLNTALARMNDGLRNLRRLWEERHA